MEKTTFGLSFCQEIVGITHGLEHKEGAMARAITRSYTLPEWEFKTCISPMMGLIFPKVIYVSFKKQYCVRRGTEPSVNSVDLLKRGVPT